jgi:PDZ domain/Aspartyl protease
MKPNRSIILAALGALGALGGGLAPAAGNAQNAQPPDPQALLAHSKEAAGGAAWDAVRALYVKVRISVGGLSGTAESWEDVSTGRFADWFQLGPVSGAEGFDGTKSWSVDPSGAVTRSDSGDAREGNADEAYRRSLSYWYPDRRQAAITAAGERSEGGRSFQVLTITPRGGRPFDLWIDTATFLFDRTVEKTSLETRTTYFSDYRDVDGLKIAFATRETNGEPKYDQAVTLESVEVNPEIDDARFSPPEKKVDDFSILGGETSTVVPFQLINNHLHVRVSLDGQPPLPMMLDSGGANVVTPETAKRLGLKTEGTFQGQGAGGSADLALTRVKSARLAGEGEGGIELRDQAFYVLPFTDLADVEGTAIDGLVGFEVFKRFVVRVDYHHQTLTLTLPEAFTPPAGAVAVPFTFDGRTPQVEGKIDGLPGRFSIDTGSRASLTIHRPFAEKHGLRAKLGAKIEALSGWGVGGGVRSVFARAHLLELGGVKVPAPVTDLVLSEKGAFNDPYLAGNVGGGVLRRFTVTFDYGHQILYFEPDAQAAEPDVWDRAGLWMNRSADGFAVMDVIAGGPADQAGIQVGDTVVEIAGKRTTDLGLAEARQILKAAPGTRVPVKVKAGGQEKEVTLVLRDLV